MIDLIDAQIPYAHILGVQNCKRSGSAKADGGLERPASQLQAS